MSALAPLPVVLPLLGAGAALLAWRHPAVQRLTSTLTLALALTAAAALLPAADRQGPVVVPAGGWPAPLGITLVADRLATLLLLTSGVVLLAVLVYAIGQGASGLSEAEPGVFHPVYLVLAAGVNLAFLSGDLFNLFVAFELMLTSSYVLLTLAPNRDRVRAGMTYTVASLTSSILLLTTVGLLYAATGTVNLAHLAERVGALPAGTRTALGLLLLVAFGTKAAVVPLHLWLPDSYPLALTKITAVFAALLTKVAVYALIRTQTLLFPREEPFALLLVLALATMLVGILGALVQDDLNRLLSFALVGHIGYMLFGLGLFTVAGLAGAVIYLVHHIVVQATLFLVSGLVQLRAGAASLRRLGGLAGATPAVAALFLVPALSLSGIPPLSGFVAKLALLQAGAAAGGALPYALTGAALVTSLLTLVAMSRVWVRAFWGQPAGQAARGGPARLPRAAACLMGGTAAAMVAAGITVAALAGPLAAVSGRAAGDLLERTPYQQAVLGEGAR